MRVILPAAALPYCRYPNRPIPTYKIIILIMARFKTPNLPTKALGVFISFSKGKI